MQSELHKLTIDKTHKARPAGKSIWPWVALAVLLAVVCGAVYEFHGTNQAIAVQTVKVRIPQISDVQSDMVALNANGYIMAAHRVELASKVLGRVAWVGVEMGDKVKKDQVIVRLEDDEYRPRVDQMKGQLDAAKAHLAELIAGPRIQEIAQAQAQYDRAVVEMQNAQRNYERLSDIKTQRSVSATELDTAHSQAQALAAQTEYQHQQLELMKAGNRKEEIDAQKATVAQLDANLAQAQLDLDNTVIRSPMDSTILERNVEVGEFVTTGFVGDRGAKGFVVSIADLSDLEVELDIDQGNFAKVSPNQPCWVTTDAYPDRKYDASVFLISPVANRQKATVEVRVKITKPDDFLKPDMNATVSFLSSRKESAGGTGTRPPICVPTSAIRDHAVYIVENGKAKKIAVSVGLTAATGDVEITKGLLGGEDLIVSPPDKLQDGDRVNTSTRS